MAIATVSSSDLIITWRQITNRLVGAINTPVFNAVKFLANGRSFVVTSNSVFTGTTTVFQSRNIANSSLTVNGTLVTKGITLHNNKVTINATAVLVGNTAIQGTIQGTSTFSANANFNGRVLAKGPLVLFNTNFQANNLTTLRGNTTVSGVTAGIAGRTLTINSNTTFQSSNTNIRGKSVLITANLVFAGSRFDGVRLEALQNVSRAPPANGDVLVYFAANSTWAPGTISGGTY